MKKMKLLLVALVFATCQVKAQQPNCCGTDYAKKFLPPKFIDSTLFVANLKSELDLKQIFDQLKKDNILGDYMYTFAVTPQGRIKPKLYYKQDYTSLVKVQKFVTEVFNHYRWQPAYKAHCRSCKITYYVQLSIYFDTDENSINVEIKDLQTLKKIYSSTIPYGQLRG